MKKETRRFGRILGIGLIIAMVAVLYSGLTMTAGAASSGTCLATGYNENVNTHIPPWENPDGADNPENAYDGSSTTYASGEM
jgi:hypothetical protein